MSSVYIPFFKQPAVPKSSADFTYATNSNLHCFVEVTEQEELIEYVPANSEHYARPPAIAPLG